ncbi:MAG TPA: transposase [Deltaproteobacteria bacterium]|nr:transposase [Deltaproteobacteria bacterium]
MSKRKGNDGADTSQGHIAQIDEAQIKGHLVEIVRGQVEEMLNGLLDAEAERLVGVGLYERSADWQHTRAGYYERSSDMNVVQIKLQMPKLRRASWLSQRVSGAHGANYSNLVTRETCISEEVSDPPLEHIHVQQHIVIDS